jgi:hypothetical protein
MGERDSLFLFLQWRREESASLFYSWQLLSNEILKAMQKVKAGVVCVFHPPWDLPVRRFCHRRDHDNAIFLHSLVLKIVIYDDKLFARGECGAIDEISHARSRSVTHTACSWCRCHHGPLILG